MHGRFLSLPYVAKPHGASERHLSVAHEIRWLAVPGIYPRARPDRCNIFIENAAYS
jgi:hypothetical protein